MVTPNGRFQTDFSICLSMSNYHPGLYFLMIDTWNPSWSVATILTGLLSFMLENTDTTGSIRTKESQKVELARASKRWNRAQPVFCRVWPELVNIPLDEPIEKVVSNSERDKNPALSANPSKFSFKYLIMLVPVLFAYLVFLKLSARVF